MYLGRGELGQESPNLLQTHKNTTKHAHNRKWVGVISCLYQTIVIPTRDRKNWPNELKAQAQRQTTWVTNHVCMIYGPRDPLLKSKTTQKT